MRVVYAAVLVTILAAVAVFVVQNNERVEVRYLSRAASLSVPALVGAAYALGMLSGWTVLGLVRTSVRRVADAPR